jgi:molybdate transport system substrate-binding protein
MIRVMSSLAIKEAYLELAPRFEKESGCKLSTIWGGMVDIKKRLLDGELADAVIVSKAAVEELIKLGQLAADSRIDLATSRAMVAVKAGAPRPDIRTTEALKKALLGAKSIGYSSGPSGVYLSKLFEGWGIAKEKLTQTPPGTPVGPLMASGQVEIGFQQHSELLPIPGIDIVGPLPADIELVTVFSGAVHVNSKGEGARRLLQFLKAPAAAPVLREKGMEPL